MDLPQGCNATLSQPYPKDGRLYCNATFDTVRCWDYTLAGTRAYGDCPERHPLSHLFSHHGYSYKDCTKNGTWWEHPLSGRPWTNYTTCAIKLREKIEESNTLIYVYLSGFAVSTALLVISMMIFFIFRELKCTRVTMHKHLFSSYILSALFWILYYKLAILDVHINKSNPVWCKVLHVLTQYSTICNYSWMLCEGLYLHTIVAFAFANKKRLLVICCIIGWVVPVVPTGIYAAVRSSDSTNSTSHRHLGCWVSETNQMWILMGPILLSLILNFIFLINILRILLSKLRAMNSRESHHYKMTARACLILVPLLGIQYVMMPFQPKGNTYVYDILKAVMISYQGAFVSLLFCFFNGEVMHCFKKHIQNCGKYAAFSRSTTQMSLNDKTQMYSTGSPTKPSGYSVVPISEDKVEFDLSPDKTSRF